MQTRAHTSENVIEIIGNMWRDNEYYASQENHITIRIPDAHVE